MKIKSFTSLPKEASDIRKKVFVEEQGFQNEFDDIDNVATHFVMFDDNEVPIATCRAFFNEKENLYILGRIAVSKEHRGQNLGRIIIEEAEKHIKEKEGKEIRIHAQCRVVAFYEKLGYIPFGETDYDESRPHVWMKKEI